MKSESKADQAKERDLMKGIVPDLEKTGLNIVSLKRSFSEPLLKIREIFRKRPVVGAFLIANFLIYSFVVFHHFRYLANDDLFITLRYSHNIARDNAFVFNPGEYVLGTTTPFLTILIGLLGKICGPLEIVLVRVLQLCLIGLAILTWRIGVRTAGFRGGLGALIPPWILLADRVLIHSFGMETPLFLFLMAALFLAYINEKHVFSGILLGLLVLTRPEGIIAAPVLFLDSIIYKRRFPWKGLISFSVIYGIWCLYALWRFGNFLPNSVSAKALQGSKIQHFTILHYIWTRYREWYMQPWMILGALGIIAALFRRNRMLFLFGGWMILCLTGYTIASAPDYIWYYLPFFWIIYLFVGFFFAELWRWISRLGMIVLKKNKNSSKLFASVILGTVFLLMAVKCVKTMRQEYIRDWFIQEDYPTGSIINIPLIDYKRMGLWVRDNIPEETKLTCIEIGILGYYSERPMNDLAGLINPSILPELDKEEYDWWIKPYELPKVLVVHIPVWKSEGIKQDFLRFFYRPVMFGSNKGLFVLKNNPGEYNFSAEISALERSERTARAKPTRNNLNQWIAYAVYLYNEESTFDAYETAYRNYSWDKYYRAGLARSLFTKKNPDYKRAGELYSHLQKDFPNDSYYLLNWVECMEKTDRFGEVVKPLTAFLKKNPKDQRVLAMISRYHRIKGDPGLSIKHAQKLLEIAPEERWYYHTMAMAMEVNGRYDEAIKFWKLFLEKSESKVDKKPGMEKRFRALESLKNGKGVPEGTHASDWPTTPRLSLKNN